MSGAPARRISRWRAELRQRRQHRAFRIAEPQWSPEQRARLLRLTEQLSTVVDQADGNGEQSDRTAQLDRRAVAEAATNLWRARRKHARSAPADSREARQVARYLRATEDALDAAGVGIQDHDGAEYHPGHYLEPLAFQDDPTLRVETVLETVKPSVYLAGERIQLGQVIVGRPVEPGTDSTTEGTRA